MSSLPPNAPPLDTSSTTTRSVGTPRTRRCRCGRPTRPARPSTRAATRSSPSPEGTASVDSGSRNACSMRWVWKTSWTTWALLASAPSTSPRAYALRDRTLSSVPHTASGAPGSIAGDRVGDRRGSTSYDTSTSSAAARACCRRLGDDDREHVAGVGRPPADRDHDRPVLVDDADAQLAGDVGGGEDRDDAVGGRRRGDVDRRHVGPGVVGEAQRGVQHAGHADVVDVAAVAEGELGAPRTSCRTRRSPRRAPARTTCPWRPLRSRRGS